MQVLQGQYSILFVLFIERGNSVVTFASFCSQNVNYAAILISLPPCTKYRLAVVGGGGGGGRKRV